ncbi:MAG: DoxX family protein [Pseudomonadota bacterium]|nr:DoxX family protein [Pseudomonadota bacterium]
MNNRGIDVALAPYGALAIRIALGSMWLAHAGLKWFVFTLPGFAAWLNSQGLPSYMAWPVFLLELVGGLAILTGFYGRYFSLSLIPIMAVAMFTHLNNGWVHTSTGGGWEYPAFLIVASLAHALVGDGVFALRAGRRTANESAFTVA